MALTMLNSPQNVAARAVNSPAVTRPTLSLRSRRPASAARVQASPCESTSQAQPPIPVSVSHQPAPTINPAAPATVPAARTAAPPSAEMSFAMLSTITLGLAGALALALPDASHASQDLQDTHASLTALQPQFDLAGGEDLLTNMARYGRYFVTVMLGTGYVMLRPLAGAFKNPLSGILATAGLVGGAFLLKFTLELMLGVTDAGDLSFEYVQGNF